ncbi:hypothetical protein BATDEDRAFT_90790 [Batrachochytrium dendrobatidis JAM81]|uniref:Vacuolar protein sorting-associated protein 54 n=2 Tax=Batrachochytrium dendrobatidis TaxID=109871 RepID=F4P983_BATDJ|nr:uncharacterized protein BATDEDRAFT_90790 [Batrachochytrium dendrobatidis JAM81]EGF78134.1 hypothetical protein BATDEDRAFT_90790 [Batrachochytrium dendrobatidis JAM81]|eukprot:XP_006681213.1 hypothetical protein BATDEDRAFT_90790 [Batrachochytrium dendrobatidis JAM81]
MTTAASDTAQLRKFAAVENPFEEVLNSEHPWSIMDIGCNAISGIANDLSSQERSFLSGSKGLKGMDTLPVIPSTPIRKIRLSEFDPYLRTLVDVIDKHQLNRALGMAATQGIPQLGSSTNSLDLTCAGYPEFQDLTSKVVGATATASSGITKMQRTRMLSVNVPSLSTIPTIFMDKDFDLTNPHTFNAASEYMNVVGSNASDENVANRQLQDKLTHHLDTVEVHLLKEISRRSSSFFSALSNLQSLHNETEECVGKIQDLRKKLASVSARTAENGLEVVRLKHRRGNVGMLYGAVKLLVDIKHSQPTIQALLGQADYVGVLDLIESTSYILKGLDSTNASGHNAYHSSSPIKADSPSNVTGNELLALSEGVTLTRCHSIIPKNLDLRGVCSLVHLSGKLSELARTISVVMENEFIELLRVDIQDKVTQMISDSMSLISTPTATAGFPVRMSSTSHRISGKSAKQKLPISTSVSTPSNATSISVTAPVSDTLPPINISLKTCIKNIVDGKCTFSPVQTPNTAITTLGPEVRHGEERLLVKLTPMILGLLRMDRLGTALHAYCENTIKQVKALVKQHYPVPQSIESKTLSTTENAVEAAAIRKKEEQAALSTQLRSMTFEKFYAMLIRVYVTSLNIIQRVSTVHQTILTILQNAQHRGVEIGSNSVQNMAVASTVNAAPTPAHETKSTPKRMLYDDDDDFGSSANLLDTLHDPLVRTKTKDESVSQSITGSDTVFDGSISTYGQMSNESLDVLSTISDLIHARCAKLIGVRSEQNAQLNAADFYRIFGATWEFITSSEIICGRICFGLKSVILTHAKAFISHFHDEKSKQIAVLVENEQWVHADIPIDFQHITEALQLDPKLIGDESENKESYSSISEDFDVEEDVLSRHSEDDNSTTEEMDLTSFAFMKANAAEIKSEKIAKQQENAPKTLRYLAVDGEKYYVVGSVLLFLKTLTDYINCAESLPVLTTDVLNRILELLKLFNSRVCQVILGAGAMQSAGLKSITARHIALAAQSIGVIIAIIPYIRKGISRLLSPKQQVLLSDFDRILRDFREHQNELYAKLISIMNDRLALHASKLGAISWDNPDSKEISAEETVTVHMAVLIKETTTLHKVLSKYLPADALKNIMGEIFRNYVQRLDMEFRKIDLFSSSGKNRLLMDVQYFIGQLSALDGIDGPGSHLEVCVNNIKIKEKRSAAVLNSGRGGAGLNTLAIPSPFNGSTGGTSPLKSPSLARSATSTTSTASNVSSTSTQQRPTSQFAYNFGKMLRSQNEGQ